MRIVKHKTIQTIGDIYSNYPEKAYCYYLAVEMYFKWGYHINPYIKGKISKLCKELTYQYLTNERASNGEQLVNYGIWDYAVPAGDNLRQTLNIEFTSNQILEERQLRFIASDLYKIFNQKIHESINKYYIRNTKKIKNFKLSTRAIRKKANNIIEF